MGRKLKLTPEITDNLCHEIAENGLTLSAASGKLKLSPSTTSRWYDKGKGSESSSPYRKFREAIDVAKAQWEARLWSRVNAPEQSRKIKSKRDKLNNILEINTEDSSELVSHDEAIWQLKTRYGYKESDRALEAFQKKVISVLEKHLTANQLAPIYRDLLSYLDIPIGD